MENDKDLDTATWLKFEKLDRQTVATLKCSVCIRYEDKLYGCRHFNSAFINGSSNLRSSSFKEHALAEMHKKAMSLFHKAQAKNLGEYYQQHAPIARALLTIDATTEARLKKKFDLAYFLSKENLAFSKMSSLCELEERRGVDLGSGYKNNQACTTFLEYVAQDFREQLNCHCTW